MKIKSNLAVIAALGLALAAPAQALAASTPAKTNNVMALNFSLTAWPNATAAPHALATDQAAGADAAESADALAAVPQTAAGVPFTILSRNLISSLNGVTNKGVAMHFSGSAQLLFRQVLSPRVLFTNSFGTNRQIIVRDTARHVADTDVSAFFSASDSYVSVQNAHNGLVAHKSSSLFFNNPGHLVLDLGVLAVEDDNATAINGVAVVSALTWTAQGVGNSTNDTPDWVVGGVIATSTAKLE
jgi:hypothetical protein